MAINVFTDLCATESENTSVRVYIKLLSLFYISYDTGLYNTSIFEKTGFIISTENYKKY